MTQRCSSLLRAVVSHACLCPTFPFPDFSPLLTQYLFHFPFPDSEFPALWSNLSEILECPILAPIYSADWCEQRNCNSREYTSGSPARFNSWLWSQNKRKVEAYFQAASEEQNWYSKLSVHTNPDSKNSWPQNPSKFCFSSAKHWALKFKNEL